MHCFILWAWVSESVDLIVLYILGDPGAELVGARESLNGRKNVARRKIRNGKKSPWGECLTRPAPNGRRHSGFWLVPKNFCVFLPNQKAEQWRTFGTGLVRHCPQGLFSPFFTFLHAIFFLPFRLSLAPTICPWFSEDEFYKQFKGNHYAVFTRCDNDVTILPGGLPLFSPAG